MKPSEFVIKHLTAIIVALFAIIIYVVIGRKCNLAPGDWGTWTGGIGTVFTLVGTIWLATDQARKTEKANEIIARLHVVALNTRVHQASEACRRAGILFESMRGLAHSATGIDDVREKINGISLWTLNELIPIAMLPTNTAATLADALGEIAKLHSSLEQKVANRNFDGPISRDQSLRELEEDAKKIHLMLKQISPHFTAAKYHLSREY